LLTEFACSIEKLLTMKNLAGSDGSTRWLNVSYQANRSTAGAHHSTVSVVTAGTCWAGPSWWRKQCTSTWGQPIHWIIAMKHLWTKLWSQSRLDCDDVLSISHQEQQSIRDKSEEKLPWQSGGQSIFLTILQYGVPHRQ
jgi:hypothetical protein